MTQAETGPVDEAVVLHAGGHHHEANVIRTDRIEGMKPTGQQGWRIALTLAIFSQL